MAAYCNRYYYSNFQPRSEISLFNGDGVDQWLHQTECFFIRYQTAPEQKFVVAVPYLSGEAREWYRQMWLARRLSTWDNFVVDLRHRFKPPEIQQSREELFGSIWNVCEELKQTLTEMKTQNSVYMSTLSKLKSQVSLISTSGSSVDKVEESDLDRGVPAADVVLTKDESKSRLLFYSPDTVVAESTAKNVNEAAESGDDDDVDVSTIGLTQAEVTPNLFAVGFASDFAVSDAETSEENFETKFCVSNTVSDVCLLPVCANAAVYLSSIPLAHKTFNGNWCSMQVFYIAAVYLKPPWEPPDGEFKFMSENYEIENINEEGLRIVWREAETKKRVTIAIESLLKIDTDAEWDFVDHSSTLRHDNDGVILLVWFEKPPPLPPEIERGLQGRFTWTKKKHDSELVKRHSEFINYSISPWIKHCFMELEHYKVGGTHDGKKLEVVACLIDDPITDDIRFNQLLSSSLHALQSLPLKIEKVKNLQNSDLSQSWFKGFMVGVVLQCKGLEILNLSRYYFAESYPYGFESSLGVRVLEKLDVFYDKYNGLITCNLEDLSRLQDGSVLGDLSSTRRLSVINIATVVSDIIITATNAMGTELSFHVEKIGEHADEAIKPKKISFLFLEVWGQINSLRVTFSNWKEVRSKTMMKQFQYYDEVVGRVFERLSTSIDTYFRGDYSGKTMVDWPSDEFKRNDDMYLPMDKQPSHQITEVVEKINRELPPTAHGPVNAETFWTTSQPSLGSLGITCIKDYVEINFIGYLEPTIDDVGFICLFAPFSESLVTRDAAMLAAILRDQTNIEAQGLLLFAVPQQSFGLKTVGATTKSTQHYLSLWFSLPRPPEIASFWLPLSLWFSSPRPPEITDLEDKVNFKEGGMLRTRVMAHYKVGGLNGSFFYQVEHNVSEHNS